jgi:[protein-PII] uridylyltransferase
VTAEVASVEPRLPSDLAALPRAQRAAACRPFLDGARARVAEAHHAGATGDVTARAWAEAIDELVTALLAAARTTIPTAQVALIAVGGYGRLELGPFSDLDLWFVVDGAVDPRLGRLAEEVLYPLWDLRLDVGHAVRAIDEAVALGREDLTAATALLDARLVTGDAALADRLDDETRRRLFAREPAALVRKLVDEKTARHQRFGDTVFLLEPDVKNGEGGYRDLLVGVWAAKARFRVRSLAELVPLGVATPRQVNVLDDARRFYLTLRAAAHLHAKRRQDRLLFEVQEAIAPALFAMSGGVAKADDPRRASDRLRSEVHPAVAPAVEWLMQRYYQHARAVKREGGRLLDRAAETPPKRPTVRRLDPSFVLWNGKVSTAGPEVFRDRPADLVRIFRVAHDMGRELYGHTCDLIAEACARPETAAALAADGAAARDFVQLLTDASDARAPPRKAGAGRR